MAGSAAALGMTAVVFSLDLMVVIVLGQMAWSVGVITAQLAFMILATILNPQLQGTALAFNSTTQYFM